MIVPNMSIPEAIAEAKGDLGAVQNKLRGLIATEQRLHRKDRRAGDRVLQGTYISPGKNHWLYNITTTKKHCTHNLFTWYHAVDGMFGLQLSHEGYHFLFTPHFFTRFRERSGEGAVLAIDNITRFFFRNPATTAMRTGRQHLGFPAFIGAVPDGYVLGTLHEDDGYHRCRTFIDHEQAFKNQQEDWEGLDAIRQLHLRHPAMVAQLNMGYRKLGGA